MISRSMKAQIAKKAAREEIERAKQSDSLEQSGILTKDAIALIAAQGVPGVYSFSVRDNVDFVQKKFAETKSARATAEALGELIAAKEKKSYFDF